MTDTPLDFGDPADLDRLRREFRAWLAEHPLPERQSGEPVPVFLRRWHRLLHSGGWVGLDVPERYGGRGLTALHQVAISDELGACRAPGSPGSAISPTRSWSSGRRSSDSGSCQGCWPVTRCGARASVSRVPVRTWRA